MMGACLLIGNAPGMDKGEAIGQSFDQLAPEDQRALLALADRVPSELGFPKIHQPTPGAQSCADRAPGISREPDT